MSSGKDTILNTEIYLPEDRSQLIRLLFFFLAIVLGCIVLGTFIQLAYLYILGVDATTIFVDDGDSRHLKAVLFITQLFTFLIPALLFGWMTFKYRMWSFFGLKEPISGRWILYSVVMLLFLLPVIQFTYEFNQSLPLPDWMTDLEDNATRVLEAIVRMDNPWDLIVNILLIALLPALGEELIFRGILQQLGYRIFRREEVSVWVIAIIFSIIHFQFEGFIPRLILGLYLGYLFLWTRNILIPVAAHFANNGLMIILSYFRPELISDLDETPVPELPWYGVVLSALCIIPLIIYFRNIYHKPIGSDKKYEV